MLSVTSNEQSAASESIPSVVARLAETLRTGTILDLHRDTIPADLIRDALLGKPHRDDKNPVIALGDIDPRGLRITNAVVTGSLDLNNTHVGPAVAITQSQLTDGMTLQNANLDHDLNLEGCSLPSMDLICAHITGQLNMRGAQLTGTNKDGDSLIADALQVDSGVFLDEGFTAAGAIHLRGAHITGQLSMRGAQLTGINQNGDSLIADALQVDSGVFLDEGFTAAGAICLPGAHVTGLLSMSGAQLTGANQAGESLNGDRLQVDSGVFLDEGFTAVGGVRLRGAHITGQLTMRGAQLTGTNQAGDSLNGNRLQVDSDLFLDDGFTAAGTIRFAGAHVTGQLSMRGAQLTGINQNGDSLHGDHLQIDSDLFLDDGFTAAGTIKLRGARLGELRVDVAGLPVRTAATRTGLTAAGAMVGDLQLNLVGVEWFAGSWVRPNKRQHRLPKDRVVLSLENCTYPHRPPGELDTWLQLLRFHTPAYEPRSYQQLAAAHRNTGHDRDSSRILMAQQDHRRAVVLRPGPGASFWHKVELWASRAGLAIRKATLGYGYRPGRALGWLLALLVTAVLLVAFAAHWPADPSTPDIPVAHRPANPEAGTPIEYCSLGEATGLAVRIAIPLVTNLGQGACIIDTTSTLGSWIVLTSIALQTFAWILGGLTIAAAATAIKRNA